MELCYHPESSGFDSLWRLWNFSFLWSFRPCYALGVDSDSNRNKYQEYFLGGKADRCLRLTSLPPSCTDFLENWEPQPLGNVRASNTPVLWLLYLHLYVWSAQYGCFLYFLVFVLSRYVVQVFSERFWDGSSCPRYHFCFTLRIRCDFWGGELQGYWITFNNLSNPQPIVTFTWRNVP